MKIIISSILVVASAFTLTAQAENTSVDVVNEYKDLFNLQKASPQAHDVMTEINYRLAYKCNYTLPLKEINDHVALFPFLLGMRAALKEAQITEPYQKALNGIDCKDIDAGMPK